MDRHDPVMLLATDVYLRDAEEAIERPLTKEERRNVRRMLRERPEVRDFAAEIRRVLGL